MMRAARIALVFCLFGIQPVSGTTWYVDASVPSPGDGSSWEGAFRTIGEAVASAGDGDTVLVAPGTYREGTLVFLKSVTLQSKDPNDPEVVASTVIEDTMVGAAYAFCGFTVRGGCVRCGSETSAITNNIIRDGAGIFSESSKAIISGNQILNNSKMYGGGIHCLTSSATVTNNVIVNNISTRNGGAIYCERCSPLILSNTIVANRASGDAPSWKAGGIYCDEFSHPTIRNCILWDNGDDLFSCEASYSCVEDGDPGEGNFNYYPYFVDLANGDYHLSPWSPCIDAGHWASPFSLEPDLNGGRVNMGAYGNTPSATSRCADVGGDGLPDEWETLLFGHLDYDAEDDPDGDRIRNVTEYLFGWDPNSPATTLVENVALGRCYEEIQPAIFEANEGDEITVFPGTYRENIDFIGKALTLRSTDPIDPAVVASTVIEGESGDIVTFTRNESRQSGLCGLYIGHVGKEKVLGRGIFCKHASPTISHNIIAANIVTGSFGFVTKEAPGAGILVYGGSPLIEHNIIEQNEAVHGAAVYCEDASPLIRENVIRQNDGPAGMIHLQFCTFATIDENRVVGNYGAGVAVWFSGVHAKGNLISLNSGTGIYDTFGGGLLRNCTIVGNGGSGIAHDQGPLPPSIVNCILWENSDDLVGQKAVYSCVQDDDAGEGNIHLDPQFIDPEQEDFRLAANSPCINAGNTASALDVTVSLRDEGALISWSAGEDLDGNPRISGKAVDMGAYEYQEGPANLEFVLEYSSDLKTWNPIAVGSVWQWLDDTLNSFRTRFYRLMPE